MLDPKFAILAAAIDFLGVASYARDTWRGTTKPNRVTWCLWALAPLIAFAAQLGEGVTYQAALTFVAGFGPAVVLVASFHDRNAYWRITKFDWLCGALSLVALALWLLTRVGNLAILLSIMADALAATPTIIKSYHHPESESAGAFGFGVIAGAITLLTVHTWTFANYAFALYVCIVCGIIFTLVQFPKLRFPPAKVSSHAE
jgi:hypothetical protein